MSQARNNNLADEKTPLLAGKPTTVVSIHRATIPVTSTCVVNRKFKRLTLDEMDDVALNPILIHLDYSSIASLLGTSPILANKIKKLLENNHELLNQCLKTCDLLGVKLSINRISDAYYMWYVQKLKGSNSIGICDSNDDDCCNYRALAVRESIFNRYKNPESKSNGNCCHADDKAKCSSVMSLYTAPLLCTGILLTILGTTNDPIVSGLVITGIILLILGGLHLANIANDHIKHRYRGNRLITEAKQNPDDLVEKLSGYNPRKGMGFLIARSKLYSALAEKKAIPKEANEKLGLTPYLMENFIYNIDANNCGDYLSVIAMLDAINIDLNNPPGMQRYRDIRHSDSFVRAMNDAKASVKISILDMKSARL